MCILLYCSFRVLARLDTWLLVWVPHCRASFSQLSSSPSLSPVSHGTADTGSRPMSGLPSTPSWATIFGHITSIHYWVQPTHSHAGDWMMWVPSLSSILNTDFYVSHSDQRCSKPSITCMTVWVMLQSITECMQSFQVHLAFMHGLQQKQVI